MGEIEENNKNNMIEELNPGEEQEKMGLNSEVIEKIKGLIGSLEKAFWSMFIGTIR